MFHEISLMAPIHERSGAESLCPFDFQNLEELILLGY